MLFQTLKNGLNIFRTRCLLRHFDIFVTVAGHVYVTISRSHVVIVKLRKPGTGIGVFLKGGGGGSREGLV